METAHRTRQDAYDYNHEWTEILRGYVPMKTQAPGAPKLHRVGFPRPEMDLNPDSEASGFKTQSANRTQGFNESVSERNRLSYNLMHRMIPYITRSCATISFRFNNYHAKRYRITNILSRTTAGVGCDDVSSPLFLPFAHLALFMLELCHCRQGRVLLVSSIILHVEARLVLKLVANP